MNHLHLGIILVDLPSVGCVIPPSRGQNMIHSTMQFPYDSCSSTRARQENICKVGVELNLVQFCYLEIVFDSGVAFVLLTCSPNLTAKPVIRRSLMFIMNTVVTFIVKVEDEMNEKRL